MDTEIDLVNDNPTLVGAISKLRFGAIRSKEDAFGAILSPTECAALWDHLQSSMLGHWRVKEEDVVVPVATLELSGSAQGIKDNETI